MTFLINGIWLFFLTLVPFATSWVGEHPNDTLPELLYAVVLLAWTIMYQILDNHIVKDNPDADIDSTNELGIMITGDGVKDGIIVCYFFLISI